MGESTSTWGLKGTAGGRSRVGGKVRAPWEVTGLGGTTGGGGELLLELDEVLKPFPKLTNLESGLGGRGGDRGWSLGAE